MRTVPSTVSLKTFLEIRNISPGTVGVGVQILTRVLTGVTVAVAGGGIRVGVPVGVLVHVGDKLFVDVGVALLVTVSVETGVNVLVAMGIAVSVIVLVAVL